MIFYFIEEQNQLLEQNNSKSNDKSFMQEDEYIEISKQHAKKIWTECTKNTRCIVEALDVLEISENDIILSYTLNDIITKIDNSSSYCHNEAHYLGEFLYGYTQDLPAAISMANQRCGGALYHGVMINYFKSEILFSNLHIEEADITKICPEDDNPYSIERWQCIHGLGHGLTVAYDYDVFSAVSRCDEFDLSFEQLSCAKGVFMENILNFRKSEIFTKENLLFPCNEIKDKFAPACYHYQTHFIKIQKKSLDESFLICNNITPTKFIKYCYYGMGREISVASFDNMESGIAWCKLGGNENDSYCIMGLLMTLINNRGLDQGLEYCNIAPLDSKSLCYDGIGKWVIMLYDNENDRKNECSKAESEQYVDVCFSANLNSITLL